MASILRQIIAGPRQQHPEAGLDLCYVTDNIIATSGPSSNYPQLAYRNPLNALVSFLDSKHGKDWAIWEFRAEGTGYPDSEVYGRIHHYPWPDHHPPPFSLIPAMMGSMRNWIQRLDDDGSSKGKGNRVAVVHCKAGKGRSGTVACGYLISEGGWKMEDAMQRFTERRMRVGFGAGVSIPSQLRYVGYIDRWTNQLGKKYVERPVEILELHVWGLKDGVKVAVEGFVDEGKKIKSFHLFHRSERTAIDGARTLFEKNGSKNNSKEELSNSSSSSLPVTPISASEPTASLDDPNKRSSGVILRPSQPLIIPSSDVNIDFERRSKASYTGFTMVTSIAHVWFNAYFEGGDKHDSGVFETNWEAMDGIKGSTKKGVRALDRISVVWRYPSPSQSGLKEAPAALAGHTINEPKPGEPCPESHPPDWHLHNTPEDDPERPLRDQENIPSQAEAQDPKQLTSENNHAPPTGNPTTATIKPTPVPALHIQTPNQNPNQVLRELGFREQTDESKDVSLANSEDERASTHGKKDKARDDSKPPLSATSGLEGVQSYFGTENESKDKGDHDSQK